jgi:hypothetical protein
MAHKSTEHQRSASALLQEVLLGVDGNAMIKAGQGFELYQSRVRTGFLRGLGTEVIDSLRSYIHAVQQNQEPVASFFKRIQQLYEQVQVTQGCEIGGLTRKAFALEGLANGAYYERFRPFVQKVHLNTSLVKLAKSSLDDIQSAGTDVLVSSRFYKDHAILPGRFPAAKARAATTEPPPPAKNKPSADPMLESIIQNMRQGRWLGPDQARWIQQKYKYIHCWTNTHTTLDCSRIKEKWDISAKTNFPPSVPRGEKSRQATSAKTESDTRGSEPSETANAAKTVTTGEHCPHVMGTELEKNVTFEAADELDDTFALHNTIETTDNDLLASMTQMAERSAEDAHRSQLLPLEQKVVARMAKSDCCSDGQVRSSMGQTRCHANL